MIALAGGSASGKSTLATAFTAALEAAGLSVVIVSMDRFMRRDDPSGPKFFFRFTQSETFNFNHPESTDNAAIGQEIDAAKADVVLVEGLMALAVSEIRERASLRVFLSLDADVRAIRRMERDIRTGRGGGDPQFIAAYYLECARVGHERYVEPSRQFADLILRGDADSAASAAILTDLVKAALASSC